MSAGNAGLHESTIKQVHYKAFLSHNGADKPLVEQVGEELERRGLSCWLDKWNLVSGAPWQPAIEHAFKNAKRSPALGNFLQLSAKTWFYISERFFEGSGRFPR